MKRGIFNKTKLKVNQSFTGETIETKIERIMNNNEPIKDGAPLIYTDRDDGVQPAYDIRTDRWDVAIDGMNAVSKAQLAKRDELAKARKESKEEAGETGANRGNEGGEGKA